MSCAKIRNKELIKIMASKCTISRLAEKRTFFILADKIDAAVRVYPVNRV